MIGGIIFPCDLSRSQFQSWAMCRSDRIYRRRHYYQWVLHSRLLLLNTSSAIWDEVESFDLENLILRVLDHQICDQTTMLWRSKVVNVEGDQCMQMREADEVDEPGRFEIDFYRWQRDERRGRQSDDHAYGHGGAVMGFFPLEFQIQSNLGKMDIDLRSGMAANRS
ncbi:hypothetical protein ACLOJK_036796 [Asimina triloba]